MIKAKVAEKRNQNTRAAVDKQRLNAAGREIKTILNNKKERTGSLTVLRKQMRLTTRSGKRLER